MDKKSLIICCVGATGSGKTTLINAILKEGILGGKSLVSYTSRPKREYEVEGVDHHFRERDFFLNNPEDCWVELTENYGNYYGVLKEQLQSDKVYWTILNMKGVKTYRDMGFKCLILNVVASKDCRINRLLEEPKEFVASRLQRIKDGELENYKGLDKEDDKLILNSQKYSVKELVSQVKTWVEESDIA